MTLALVWLAAFVVWLLDRAHRQRNAHILELEQQIGRLQLRIDDLEETIDQILIGPDGGPDGDGDGEKPGVLTETTDAVGEVIPLRRSA